ncbi:MAG: DUF547 domain-containing protein [Cyclobacteriaceae bacterium]|nr:DUF547 domain-containing protein [Cyclobacteriaceae bacterium HetDA_MAG_MS6]
MKALTTITLLTCSILAFGQDDHPFFDKANAFLMEHVKDGLIDYNQLRLDHSDLDSLTTMIEQMDLSYKSKEFEKAFCVNAYNLLVIKHVLDNYPVKSPKDVDGFFNKKKFKVAGNIKTLDEIEFQMILEKFPDPRIHFVLNCAAISCPTLYNRALYPKELEDQMMFRAKMIVDRDDYVKVQHDTKEIYLCKVFEWYQDQFTEKSSSLVAFVNTYRFYSLPKNYEVKFLEYDWTLNDVK